MKDILVQFEELALGSRLKRLSDQLMKEATKVYSGLNVDFDPYHMPVFKLISEKELLTIGQISQSLNVTQPAVTQYINALQKLNLITSQIGKKDRRQKKIALSKQGKLMLDRLQPIWKIIDAELKILTHNSKNKTLLDHIRYIENELEKVSFKDKILSKINLMKNKATIVSFREEFANDFRDLNIEWLEKYFYVEEHDEEVLGNAKTYIIDNGGYIFFALHNGDVAGTVALINEPEGYELSKMAVSPKFQGLKIGQQLMQYCIDFAKEKGWSELLLYSNTVLENAIYIYRKYGFKEVEIDKNNPYQRGNIKMVLKL